MAKFNFDKRYAANLRNKIQIFREGTQTKKAIFLTMITTYGLVESACKEGLVQNEITMDALFE